MLTYGMIENSYNKKGYQFHKQKGRMNVFGIRKKNGVPDKYDDTIGLAWSNGTAHLLTYAGTTDPGLFFLRTPLNVNGTFILMPGQYVDSHMIGIHRTYRALVQIKQLKGWRDNNKNDIIDYDPVKVATDATGVNIHYGDGSFKVGMNSAGCQVIYGRNNFEQFMDYIDAHVTNGFPNRFTYTLFDEDEVVSGDIPSAATVV